MQRSKLLMIGLATAASALVGCSTAPMRGMLPPLQGAISDERPPWLRDLPVPLERYPAPQGWGGDNLAAQEGRTRAG